MQQPAYLSNSRNSAPDRCESRAEFRNSRWTRELRPAQQSRPSGREAETPRPSGWSSLRWRTGTDFLVSSMAAAPWCWHPNGPMVPRRGNWPWRRDICDTAFLSQHMSGRCGYAISHPVGFRTNGTLLTRLSVRRTPIWPANNESLHNWSTSSLRDTGTHTFWTGLKPGQGSCHSRYRTPSMHRRSL